MEGSKANEMEEEASDDIFDDPIFKDPAQRLETKKYNNNLNLPNKYNILGMRLRLSNLKTSAIQRDNNRAISNDSSILAINILPMKTSKPLFIQKILI